jgi:glutamate N-acetyltransferase/amino-acid N-acetyltransferase
VTPAGFLFFSGRAGIKKNGENDIGIIVSEVPCVTAGVFTRNLATAAPVLLSRENLRLAKRHRAIICNSGCANAAMGKAGMKDAELMAELVAHTLFCRPEEVLVASTGVIGEKLPMDKIKNAVTGIFKKPDSSPAGFARAIMTTDAGPKTARASVNVGGKKVKLLGVAKGAGMIHPDMATMLAFIVTDAAVGKPLLKKILREAVEMSFNRITVDGDTSTNDSVFFMANGAAGNLPVKSGTADYEKLSGAVSEICSSLAEQIVADGEGATRVAEIRVEKAKNPADALAVAKTVAGSLLVKTALHGGDPNWGRIIAAAGRSGVVLDADKVELYFGKYCAFRGGVPVGKESVLAREMRRKKVLMRLVLHRGKAEASYLFCDIGRDYISINADYRS